MGKVYRELGVNHEEWNSAHPHIRKGRECVGYPTGCRVDGALRRGSFVLGCPPTV
jgi:hypothetical protein